MATANGAAALLFLASEPRECSGLLRRCTGVRKLDWPLDWARAASLRGRPVLLVAHGAGPERAAQAFHVAAERATLLAVVSAGYCGALREELAVGGIVAGTEVRAAGGVLPLRLPHTPRACASGPVASTARVAQTAGEKARLRDSGAAIVEMECAGIAAAAARMGLPTYCIRSVTDLASESFELNWNAALDSAGRFSTVSLIRQALRKPGAGFAELIRLYRRSRMASRNLGEFLADCRF